MTSDQVTAQVGLAHGRLMKKQYHEQKLFDMETDDDPQGPVECLDMTFENDEKRREYFLEKLLREFEKLESGKVTTKLKNILKGSSAKIAI